MSQPDLFTPANTLTGADIDEWAADIRTTQAANPTARHHPHEWVLADLGDLLGEDIPAGPWSGRELLALLGRAREALAGEGRTDG